MQNGLRVKACFVLIQSIIAAGIAKAGQIGFVSPGQDTNFAWVHAHRMGVFDLNLVAIMFADLKVHLQAIGHFGAGQASEPQDPVSLVPFTRKAPAKTPCIGRIVKRGVGPIAPIHELGSRIFGIGVVIEHVKGREVSSGQHESVFIDSTGHLIEIRFNVFRAATLVPGLS